MAKYRVVVKLIDYRDLDADNPVDAINKALTLMDFADYPLLVGNEPLKIICIRIA